MTSRSSPSRARTRTAVRVRRSYDASADTLFAAWLDAATAGRWLFATSTRPVTEAAIDARVAGRFRFVEQRARDCVQHTGEYLAIERHRRLVFTLASEPEREPTRVVVEFVATGRGAHVTVTHAQVPKRRAAELRGRWSGMLYGLGEVCASRIHEHDEDTSC